MASTNKESTHSATKAQNQTRFATYVKKKKIFIEKKELDIPFLVPEADMHRKYQINHARCFKKLMSLLSSFVIKDKS